MYKTKVTELSQSTEFPLGLQHHTLTLQLLTISGC